jgi:flagellar biosynthesis protein FlhB
MTQHEASAKKLRRAREEGNSGISTVATSAVGFVVAAAVVPMAGTRAAEHLASLVKASIADAASPAVLNLSWPTLAGELVSLTAPPLFAVAATAALVSGTQAGGVFAMKKLFAFKWDIAGGFKNLVSPTRIFGVVRSLVGATVVAWLVYRALREHARDIAATTGRLDAIVPVAAVLVKELVWKVAMFGVALGAIDALITRLHWKRGLRMEPTEVKRELRESQGDPAIKAARERAHHEVLKAAAIHEVKKATMVVVTEKASW